MTTAIKRRRGTTTQHSTFTGLEGELTVDTTKETVVVHDGSTAGGFPLLREDLSNNTNVLTTSNTKTLTNKSIDLGSNTVTGTVAQFNAAVTDGDLLTTTGTETLTNKTLTSPTINGNVATTGINFDSNTFVIDATNDRVGVGTSTPGTKLDVNGVVTATGGTSTNWNSAFGWGNHASAGYAADSSVVHLAGTETISGAKTFSTAPTVAGLSNSGNLTFTGTGNRITGDFGNGTIANRVAFQSSTTNGATVITALPNGTGTQTQYEVFNSSDTTNSSRGQFFMNASELSIRAQNVGTGSYLPITAWTGGSERLRIDTSGNVGIGTSSPTAGIKLEVNGVIATRSTAPTIQLTDTTATVGVNFGLYNGGSFYAYGQIGLRDVTNSQNAYTYFSGASGYHNWFTNGTERMRIDSTGNLGLGVTPSAWALSGLTALQIRNAGFFGYLNRADITANIYVDNLGAARYIASSTATQYAQNISGDHRWFIAASGTAGNTATLTQAMTLDSGGNFGLGTSSPTGINNYTIADIRGTTGSFLYGGTTSAAQYRFGYNGSNGALEVNAITSIPIQFFTNSTERMRIDSSGNVGIGTSSPSNRFVVSNGGAAGFEFQPSTGKMFTFNRSTSAYTNMTLTADVMAFNTGGETERMRITNSGSVLIGNTSGTSALSFGPVIPSNGQTINVFENGNTRSGIGVVSGVFRHYTDSGSVQSFGQVSTSDGSTYTERMRITSGGNVGIGLTPAANHRLSIAGGSTANTDFALVTSNSGSATTFAVRNDGAITTGATTSSPYNLTTSTAANMVVGSDGYLYRSTSSLKYKTDVEDATHGLAEVLQLRPVTYKGKNDGDTVFGGLIAEEVDAIGLTEFVQYAEDGSPDALAYSNMVSLLAKAIQEQQAMIEELKAEVALLKASS